MQLKDLFKKTNYITLGSEEAEPEQKKSAPSAQQSAADAAERAVSAVQAMYKRAAIKASSGRRQESNLRLEVSEMLTPFCKCPGCGELQYIQDVKDQASVCPHCGYHFRLGAPERIAITADPGTFTEWDADLISTNVLKFPGYDEKLRDQREKTGQPSAVMTGVCTIEGHKTVLAAMDSRFMMGSMGQAVGEKITRAIERATQERLPIVIFTTSGGARMQEGIFSLMQMAKTSAALAKHDEQGLLYIAVLTDPTTGGVTASFAMLGDIILAEPHALIGFAGRRVIEQTIKERIPKEFQTAEFLEEHGFVDEIVPRLKMRNTLGTLLMLHGA